MQNSIKVVGIEENINKIYWIYWPINFAFTEVSFEAVFEDDSNILGPVTSNISEYIYTYMNYPGELNEFEH